MYRYTPAVDVHLPCPPLREWLPARLDGQQVGAWVHGRRVPRTLRRTLAQWPRLTSEASASGERASAVELAQLDALIFGVRLERADPPSACVELLRPGALIIELAQPRARPLRHLLGAQLRPSKVAQLSQARALHWLERGCYALEQWQSVDPQGVLVTLARVR